MSTGTPKINSPKTGSGVTRAVLIDYARYDRYLENADMSDTQKRAFLDGMWALITEIMLMGYAVEPDEAAQYSCGKDADTPHQPTALAVDGVDCTSIPKTDFKSAAKS